MIKRKLGLECGLQKITEQRSYEVKYFGSTVLVEPDMKRIREAIRQLVGDIIVKGKERSLPKVTLRVLQDGLHLREKQKKSAEKIIPIRKLSYGTFMKSDVQLLAFNHHMEKTPAKMECFVVWCETDETLKDIGLAIYSAVREQHFQSVREHRKESRPSVLEEKEAIKSVGDACDPAANDVSTGETDPKVNFELHDDEDDQYLSLPDLSASANESDLRTALEDMLKVVEEEEMKDGLKNNVKCAQ
ncbi:low density lipo receptor adapter 1-like [Paramuricea clavata]|nr:low density lipo receptor adapter 1-like [Paramuricea clavata]